MRIVTRRYRSNRMHLLAVAAVAATLAGCSTDPLAVPASPGDRTWGEWTMPDTTLEQAAAAIDRALPEMGVGTRVRAIGEVEGYYMLRTTTFDPQLVLQATPRTEDSAASVRVLVRLRRDAQPDRARALVADLRDAITVALDRR